MGYTIILASGVSLIVGLILTILLIVIKIAFNDLFSTKSITITLCVAILMSIVGGIGLHYVSEHVVKTTYTEAEYDLDAMADYRNLTPVKDITIESPEIIKTQFMEYETYEYRVPSPDDNSRFKKG